MLMVLINYSFKVKIKVNVTGFSVVGIDHMTMEETLNVLKLPNFIHYYS